MNDPILHDLNREQEEAVLHTEGPLLVLAGAGSGKTRVITRRIAYLIGRLDVKPWQILALSFTNKAAEEMKKRVEVLLQQDGLSVWIGTFHSTCAKILRKHAAQLGLPASFLILDEADQISLIKECLKELDLSEKSLHPRMVRIRIGKAKAGLLGPAEYALGVTDFTEERVAHIFRLYQEKLRRSSALDFDDLLLQTAVLFERGPSILRSYQELWRYILVDEYQDTNPAQYRLIRLLTSSHQNLCVVGDDDQSIYGFRGADLSNILDFERDYPGCRIIRLEQNYRSTKRILEAASGVIAHNVGRKGKRLWTQNGEGEPLVFFQAQDGEEEAHFIAEAIASLAAEEGRSFDDFAVFYRTNAQSRALEDALRRRLIPYVIVGGLRFYERKEVKDILAYLRVIANPSDEVSLKRIFNVPPRGIGKATWEELLGFARSEGISLWEACRRLVLSPSASLRINSVEGAALSEAKGAVEKTFLPKKARRALGDLIQLIERYRTLPLPLLSDLILDILKETGYEEELLREGTPEAQARLENLEELASAAQEFLERSEDKSLQAFLDQVALITSADEFHEEQGAVALMTLHMAKGLEFPIVFMSGMEEGIFPHAWAMASDNELEEERRLCYVGMTRAKERLYLTTALKRRVRGGFGLPSRFLEEIPKDLIAPPPLPSPSKGEGWVGVDSRPEEPFVDHLRPGMRVKHPEWGIGVVRERHGSGEDLKVVVSFPGVGTKKLAAKYAELERA